MFITPDGDFSDWDAIPEDELAVSEVPADAFYPTGRKVMAYAGETFINLYVEFKNQADMPVQIMHLYIDSDMAFDGEGNPTTGMGNPAWTNDGSDLLFEGYVVDEESAKPASTIPRSSLSPERPLGRLGVDGRRPAGAGRLQEVPAQGAVQRQYGL